MRVALAVGLAALLTLVGSTPPEGSAQAVDPPNVVVLVVDDMSNAMFARATNLRRGSETHGVSFSNAVATTPLCCPARGTLLTGRYAHNHGVRTNTYASGNGQKLTLGGERRFIERGNERRTVAYHLSRNGYRTGLVGKYMNGYGSNDGGPSRNDPEAPPDEVTEDGSHRTRVPPGWSDWHGLAGRGINDNGRWACLVPTCAKAPTADGRHASDQISRRAVDFVESADEPFFLYLADEAPHNEVPPPARHAHSHDGAKPPKPPSFNEKDVSDKPGYIARDRGLTPQGVRPAECSADDWPIRYPTTDDDCWHSEDYSRHVWEYGLEGLEGVDDLYESVVASLARTGELENTYIFLVSDNGLHLGEHRQSYGKNTPYIEDLRTTFVVRGPRTPRGAELPHVVGLQDLAPTVLDLAGVPVPASMDGRSLRPLLRPAPPPTSAWRKRIGIEGWAGGGTFDRPYSAAGDEPPWRGVFDARRRFTQYSTGERELYQLPGDPYELENRAGDAPAAELTNLRRQADALQDCSGASCRAAENR